MRAGQSGTGIRHWPLSAKLLILSSLVTILGFSAVCGSVLLDMRRGEQALARQIGENLASTIDADIGRMVELCDLSLRAVVSGLKMPEIGKLGPSLRRQILFDHATRATHFSSIQVFDANGDLTIDASTSDPPPENRLSEEFFKVHRGNADTGLFISRPMLHRGAYSVVLSRRLAAPDGRFAGVVAGAIRFSYFHELFDRLTLGADNNITVVRNDGTVIMRMPFDLDIVGKDFGKSPGVMRMLAQPGDTYSGNDVIDDIDRLYVWRNSNPSLMVVVGRPLSGVYGMWRQQAIRIGIIMLALIGFITGVTMFLAREIGRRDRAENMLENLATTDALTGLRNRRKFDAEIKLEWQRAVRQATPLALLLIDADHFKSFNDTFGHQPGDHALIAIAKCIANSVHRAGDCAARYGGEEFAVLLPGNSADDAYKIAETIRGKVEQLRADGAALTISIGIASLTPTMTMEWSSLVEAADKALYAAKDAGRNRSVIANPPHRLRAA